MHSVADRSSGQGPTTTLDALEGDSRFHPHRTAHDQLALQQQQEQPPWAGAGGGHGGGGIQPALPPAYQQLQLHQQVPGLEQQPPFSPGNGGGHGGPRIHTPAPPPSQQLPLQLSGLVQEQPLLGDAGGGHGGGRQHAPASQPASHELFSQGIFPPAPGGGHGGSTLNAAPSMRPTAMTPQQHGPTLSGHFNSDSHLLRTPVTGNAGALAAEHAVLENVRKWLVRKEGDSDKKEWYGKLLASVSPPGGGFGY